MGVLLDTFDFSVSFIASSLVGGGGEAPTPGSAIASALAKSFDEVPIAVSKPDFFQRGF